MKLRLLIGIVVMASSVAAVGLRVAAEEKSWIGEFILPTKRPNDIEFGDRVEVQSASELTGRSFPTGEIAKVVKDVVLVRTLSDQDFYLTEITLHAKRLNRLKNGFFNAFGVGSHRLPTFFSIGIGDYKDVKVIARSRLLSLCLGP